MKTPLTPSRNLWITLAALAASAVLAPPADARWNDDTWAEGNLVNVQLCVGGRPAPLYPSPQGDERHYFQAVEGGNYSVMLRNNSDERVGVLIAVDGLNVVSGERTSLSADKPMYVLGPRETATIQGWRTSLDEVQRFVFVDEQHSYAERTGQANGDMGWIRVLAFREQRSWWQRRHGDRWNRRPSYDERGGREEAPDNWPPAPIERGAAPSAVPPGHDEAAPSAARSESKGLRTDAMQEREALAGHNDGDSYPGTGWGEQRNDSVRRVEFTAERVATDHHVIRYEYASGLRALGIFPDHDRLRDRDHGALGFARPPRW
jgi:hypothetical protein